MKKSILTLSAAAVLAGCLSLASCAGNKTQQAEEVAEEVTVVEEDNTPVLSTEQKNALIASALVTADDFSHTVFIDFNATWCGPCRQFAPFFEAAAEKYGDRAKFIAVDVDQYGDVANAFGVQSIPTMIAVQPDGKYVTYVGTAELVGDGAFDAIVEKFI